MSPLDAWQLLLAKKHSSTQLFFMLCLFIHIKQKRYNVLISELYRRATLRVSPVFSFFFVLSLSQFSAKHEWY